jgi:hypothetical protein
MDLNDDAASETSAKGGVFWFMLISGVGGSVVYVLYVLLVFLVKSFGSVLHHIDSEGEPDFSGVGGSSGNSEVCLDINHVFYPVSYWTERGGRPYQVSVSVCFAVMQTVCLCLSLLLYFLNDSAN